MQSPPKREPAETGAARDSHRTVSNLIELALIQYLQRERYLPRAKTRVIPVVSTRKNHPLALGKESRQADLVPAGKLDEEDQDIEADESIGDVWGSPPL